MASIFFGSIEADIQSILASNERFSISKAYDPEAWFMHIKNDKRLAELPKERRKLILALGTVSETYTFIKHVLHTKILELLSALVSSSSKGSITVCFLLSRSLLEHVGSAALIERKYSLCFAEITSVTGIEKINSALKNFQLAADRIYYGSSERDAQQRPYHANEFVRALEVYIADVSNIYDYLSQFVHPNFRGNRLVSSGQLLSGKISSELNLKPAEKERLNFILANLLGVFERLFDEQNRLFGWDANGEDLRRNVDRLFDEQETTVTYQKVKKPRPHGSGETPKDAIWFSNARDLEEAFNMRLPYLRSKGYEDFETLGDEAFSDETWVYEVFLTETGQRIWFKALHYSG